MYQITFGLKIEESWPTIAELSQARIKLLLIEAHPHDGDRRYRTIKFVGPRLAIIGMLAYRFNSEFFEPGSQREAATIYRWDVVGNNFGELNEAILPFITSVRGGTAGFLSSEEACGLYSRYLHTCKFQLELRADATIALRARASPLLPLLVKEFREVHNRLYTEELVS